MSGKPPTPCPTGYRQDLQTVPAAATCTEIVSVASTECYPCQTSIAIGPSAQRDTYPLHRINQGHIAAAELARSVQRLPHSPGMPTTRIRSGSTDRGCPAHESKRKALNGNVFKNEGAENGQN